eukprot:gnl/MRDRNA2_/MRDRNA2_82546_c0_seq4.p1 gnl/MRDRNA2_/MRDRNA2_82546_c0~~gnl/MRDRNA2_/MRDRNA2_82546_c0_seq4.p1  ORF type:complete len:304 (-),score=58.67 gnl/MRDRNA2_/MRDRNA2_82546_c0_seq4:388-1299(-)
MSTSSDWKAWALAAGAFGAGVFIGTKIKENQPKKDPPSSGPSSDLHYANGNPQCTLGNQIVTSEKELVEDLAIGHRLVTAYGMDELQANHFSARLPGWAADDFWCTPGNRMWADLRPEHMVKKSANITTNVLHTAVYQACPDALAVCHVHAPAVEALSCLEGGLQIYSQGGMPFYERVAYHDWQGISDDDNEAEDIIKAFKTSPKPARALIMRNHGAITLGKSVAEAFVLMYYLNRTCATQLAVLSTGAEINYPPEEVVAYAAQQIENNSDGISDIGCEWPALKAWVKNLEQGAPPLVRSNLS